jgi:hypothetical protein
MRPQRGQDVGKLHIPPILPTHLMQRMADLPFAVVLHRFHQLRENVLSVAGGLLQSLELSGASTLRLARKAST